MTASSITSENPSETAVFTRRFASAGGKWTVAVKDCFDFEGQVTTSGSRALAGAPPATSDSEVVRRLRAAGCDIVGRANMHELAYGVIGVNHWTGTPTNPNHPTLVPGGSSSGSAVAVAAGIVDFSIGTDTGGSIRVPATCCGIVGLKPTFGRVSRAGVHPAVSSLDCVGPFARSVAMIEQAMAILTPDWREVSLSSGRPKLAFFAPPGDPEIASLARAEAESCFDLTDIELPRFEAGSDAGMTVISRETWNACGHLTKSGLVGHDVHERLLMSAKVTDDDLAAAEAVRTSFTGEVDAVLAEYEAIALPAMTYAVPSLLEVGSSAAPKPITLACRPFNLSGHPAIALPIGEVGGRPVSLQLVGRKGQDEALCALARQVAIFTKGER